MRLRKNYSDAGLPIGEGGTREPRRRESRGWGPFTGGQLTIVIVAIAAMFAIPTAALAAGASFTSNSNGTPAVNGKNTASNGIGVSGKGKHYGVFSNGPLGVAAGKGLSCSACVTPADLSLLPSGQSESGMYAAGGAQDAALNDLVGVGITYAHPLATPILNSHVIDTDIGANPHCPRPGAAARGYLCLYPAFGPGSDHNVLRGYGYSSGGGELFSRPSVGMEILWQVTGTSPLVYGEYTVTAQ